MNWKAVNKKALLTIMIVAVSSIFSTLCLYQVYSLGIENSRLQASNDVLRRDYLALSVNYTNLHKEHSKLQTEYSEVEFAFLNLQDNYSELLNQYNILEAHYNTLEADYSTLETEYNTLATDFSSLSANYSSLQKSYTEFQLTLIELQNNYTELQNNYGTLETDYDSLLDTYFSVSINYTILQREYAELQGNYNTLQENFLILNSDYQDYISSYQELCNQVNQRLFWRADIKSFITPKDSIVKEIVNNITDGWNDPFDSNEYWREIKELYLWVRDDVEYRSDGLYPLLPILPSERVDFHQEMWQFSNETIELKNGDCDDQAILLCSMVNCYSNQSQAEILWIVGQKSSHLAVQILVSENKLVILDPAGNYFSHNYLGDIVFNDISYEINEWIDNWKPSLGEGAYIQKIFSEQFEIDFSETSEYIEWMYSREQ